MQEQFKAMEQSQVEQLKKTQLKEQLVNELSSQIKVIHEEMQKSTVFLEGQIQLKANELKLSKGIVDKLSKEMKAVHLEMKESQLALQ